MAHLAALTNLESLELNGTSVSDEGLIQLKAMTSLKSLYLPGAKVSQSGAQILQRALPRTKISLSQDEYR